MIRRMSNKYKGIYNKALARKSRKAAIRSMCLECVQYQEKEVRECTDPGCPLYRYRETG